MANEYTMEINQGSDFRINIRLKDENEAYIDLTGYTLRGQLRKKVKASTPAAEFSFDVKDQVTDTGSFDVYLTSEETALIKTSGSVGCERVTTCYLYDIELVSGSVVTRILEGKAEVSPEVTR